MPRRLRVLATALVLTAANLSTWVAPASAAPQAGETWTVHVRPSGDGQSVTVPGGASNVGELSASVAIGPDWSGWATPKKGKWKFTITDNIDMVSGSFDNWGGWQALYATSSTDPNCFEMNWKTAASLTLKSTTCADTVWVVLTVDIMSETPPAGTTFTTNLNDVSLIANGTTITPSAGLLRELVLTYNAESSSSLSVQGSDVQSVDVSTSVCVDENLVSAGDEATVTLVANSGGSALSTTSSDVAAWVRWRGSMYSGATNGDTVELHSQSWWENGVETDPLENVVETFDGTITLPETGSFTLSATADIRVGGTSVLESCPPSGDAWPDAIDATASNATMDATTAMQDLPADMEWNASTLDWQTFTPDGFGGLFTSTDTSPNSDPPTFSASHFDAAGASNDLGPSGSLTDLPEGPTGGFWAQRWGVGGNRWLSLGGPDWSTETERFLVGDFIGTEPTDLAIPIADVNHACHPSKNTGDSWVTTVPIQSSNPYVIVQCSYKLGKKGYTDAASLARIDPSGGGSIALVSSLVPVPKKPSTVVAQFEAFDPTASGTEVAVWVYTEVTSGAKKSLQTVRTITTMTASGVVTQTPITYDPFPSGTPDSLTLVPGTSNGQWKGTSITPDGTVNVISVVGNTTVTERSAPSAVNDYGYNVTPLAVSSSGRLVVGVSSVTTFDNVYTVSRQTGILSADGSSVSWGEEVSTDVYTHNLLSWLWEGMWGVDAGGNPVTYLVTSRSRYQVVTWDLP